MKRLANSYFEAELEPTLVPRKLSAPPPSGRPVELYYYLVPGKGRYR